MTADEILEQKIKLTLGDLVFQMLAAQSREQANGDKIKELEGKKPRRTGAG